LHELYKTSAHARFIRHLLELMRRDRQHSESPEDMENPLSKRQTEIMQLVAAGYSNRDIADQLFISEQTVKKHLGTAFVRLDVSSRTQAIDVCRRLNIL
jgi:LuxR family maltose regulon positive regulatory protein